jgi:16S rRNA (uracil1498-N3)-methyltransferase
VPVEAARTDRGLERAAHKRLERWRRIALESSQQSRRAFLPDIAEPVAFRDALAFAATHRIALDESQDAPRLFAPLAEATDSIAVLIGPEGGWTDQERSEFIAANWTPASLGPLILRAETAAIAALAIINSPDRLH